MATGMTAGTSLTVHPTSDGFGLGYDPNILSTLPPDERKYWEKHQALQQYRRPLQAMIKQLDRYLI